MATFLFKCKTCDATPRYELTAPIGTRVDPPACPECLTLTVRDFRTEGAGFGAITHAYYSENLGRVVSSPRDVLDTCKQLNEQHFAEHGYESNYVPVDRDNAATPKNECAVEAANRAIHDASIAAGARDKKLFSA